MSDVILDNYGVTEKKGIPVVSSRKVAEIFTKQHNNVLRDIENIIGGLLKIEQSDWQKNFIQSNYKNLQNKKQPEYLLTRDGFTLLAMGFTGKKAIQFKVAYINRFNQMEQFIKNLSEAKTDFPEFTEAIMLAHEEPKHYHFSNELDMINRIVIGMGAKQFKETHGLGKVSSIRPYLTYEQIDSIKKLQRIDIGLIVAIPEFQERKQVLTDYHRKRVNSLAIAQ